MSKPLKILIVRFSSIGDIVLTTPVIRSLKNQLKAEIHFLTKYQYHSIVASNFNLDKVFYLSNSLSQTLKDLRSENYDYIIDLHNNIRSQFLLALGIPITRYSKSNFKKFIYMNFGVNYLNNEHVVDRYMKTISFLDVKNDGKGLDYFISNDAQVAFDIKQDFIAWSIGGSKIQKKLSPDQISQACLKIDMPIILLGSEKEKLEAEQVIGNCSGRKIYNFCGRLSLDQSALIIKNCIMLLSNDTGLMHIGAAFNKNIISFWGCTKPDMGFSPYVISSSSIEILSEKSEKQCSKHGDSCRFTKDGCVKLINSEKIYEAVQKFRS